MSLSETCSLLAVVVALAVAPIHGRSQSTGMLQPLRDSALTKLQAEDWQGAAAMYRRVVRADSVAGIDWFRLGYALHQGADKTDYPEAIRAMEQAYLLGAQVPSALFRRARMLSSLGDSVRSVQVLDTLVQSGFAQADLILQQEEFIGLRNMPSFEEVIAGARRNEAPCMASEEARQFDFWVGDWDVFAPSGAQVGSNHVESTLRGCALLENWTGSGGRSGKSFNFYDPSEDTWKEFWTDDSRWIVYYTHGEYRDGGMHMQGVTYDARGDTVLIRMRIMNESSDTVRQFIDTSPDQGRTWSQSFEGIYVRREGG